MSVILLAALASDWSYVARSSAIAGGGPAATRDAPSGEPVLVTCDRRTSTILIGGVPGGARDARLRSDGGGESWVRPLHGRDAGAFLPVLARARVLDGVADERKPLTVAYRDGQQFAIAPVRAVARVIRECRSQVTFFVPLK